ncbi:MAG: sigma-70 family polymerase sigma factor, partial [Myxococcaceae bacterium]|nr:sigma-70 family polymerase sigma factor [Myxococcaceae bacterium]
FLLSILAGTAFGRLHETKGRLRDWVKAGLRRHVWRAWQRMNKHSSWTDDVYDEEASCCASHAPTADRVFDRAWSVAVVKRAIDRVANSRAALNHPDRFASLRGMLIGPGSDAPECSARAAALGTTPGALKTWDCRVRATLKDALFAELEQLVDPSEVEAELAFLLSALEEPDTDEHDHEDRLD